MPVADAENGTGLADGLWRFDQAHAGYVIVAWAAHFRPMLMVTGARGSGKLMLAEIEATLTGPMALILDEVEAALRQGCGRRLSSVRWGKGRAFVGAAGVGQMYNSGVECHVRGERDGGGEVEVSFLRTNASSRTMRPVTKGRMSGNSWRAPRVSHPPDPTAALLPASATGIRPFRAAMVPDHFRHALHPDRAVVGGHPPACDA